MNLYNHGLIPSTLCSLTHFPSIYFSFIFFPYHRHPLYTIRCYFFGLPFFLLHSFILSLLALMSVAMVRSIQDGVFVLSTERKMNVAAMHHSLLTV